MRPSRCPRDYDYLWDVAGHLVIDERVLAERRLHVLILKPKQ